MVSETQQRIYNCYLRVVGESQNRPYRARKDFSDFENNENYVYLLKLDNFFKKFPHINCYDFMKAPYEVYPEKTTYHLDFYISQKAIKVYTIWNKQRCDAEPDSEVSKEFIKRSFAFIYKFCKEKNIPIMEYARHKTDLFPSFMIHLREHHISMYVLFGYDEFESMFASVDKEEAEFLLGSMYESISKYRTRFMQSVNTKKWVKKCLTNLAEH